jgi:choline dehydrogenase-like flavoprotein
VRGLDLVKDYLEARGGVNFRITTDLSGGPEHWTFDPNLRKKGNALNPGDHHMGAFRMSTTAEDGIVDPNLKVHSVDNLFLAGCGVFPTAGYANPTLTIVALALRLADYLK